LTMRKLKSMIEIEIRARKQALAILNRNHNDKTFETFLRLAAAVIYIVSIDANI